MTELSIIIPYVNEYPQIAFTVQNLWCELRDRVDFEIIVVNNYCDAVKAQGHVEDKGGQFMASIAARHSWLKAIDFEEKLSHWQAKNVGVRASQGRILFFVDAHCIVSRDALYEAFCYYRDNYEVLNGTLHLPLSYMLEKPGLELIYKLVADPAKGIMHYSFTRYREATQPYRVPCMSTCGMLMTRELYDLLGGWPQELGIYGGGENFVNFTLAVLGKTVNIMPGLPLFHYAEKRGYNWNYNDWVRNRCIAAYIHSGTEFAKRFIRHVKGDPLTLQVILSDVLEKCKDHRERIKTLEKINIEDWVKIWD